MQTNSRSFLYSAVVQGTVCSNAIYGKTRCKAFMWDPLNDRMKFLYPYFQNTAQFEDFERIRTLGTGSFGRVMLVIHRTSNQYHAMKILDKGKVLLLCLSAATAVIIHKIFTWKLWRGVSLLLASISLLCHFLKLIV